MEIATTGMSSPSINALIALIGCLIYIDFFGADKVLFASDCPFDKEKGPGYIRSTIAVLESLDLKPADREKISYKNAQALFGVK